jgi:ammonium transporter, Amt family
MTLRLSARLGLLGLALGVLAVTPALGQTPATPTPPKIDTGDTAWMLTSTALVLMMTIPGLALFYGGMVRRKNALATLTQCFAICCLVSVMWMIFGYSLAFTDGGGLNAFIGGFSKAFLVGVNNSTVAEAAATIPEWVFIMFQMTFAIITPALIIGGFAERIKFSALMWFVVLWMIFVYCPVAHWVWGGGFLGDAGVLDFAGGTVVHINAGIAALVGCIIVGKRNGYGTANLAPHNLTLSLIGASLLWVGWFGFNAGSAVGANALAGAAMINTQVATAAAALAWMFCEWVVIKKPSLLGILSGAIGGLVAITPAAGYVNPTGALVIGILAGIACYVASVHVKKALGYDDSLDVFGVHGVAGIVGALLVGLLADAAINEAGKDARLITQFYGVAVTVVYTAVVTAIILYALQAVMGLRPGKVEEEEGLDLTEHGERAYTT